MFTVTVTVMVPVGSDTHSTDLMRLWVFLVFFGVLLFPIVLEFSRSPSEYSELEFRSLIGERISVQNPTGCKKGKMDPETSTRNYSTFRYLLM